MRAAVIQLVSTARVQENLAEAEKQIRAAVIEGADLVVLPEYFGVIPRHEAEILAFGETDGSGPMQDFLANLAASLSVVIVGGSLPLQSEDRERVTNSLLIFDRSGRRIARYDKIHLFDVTLPELDEHYEESKVIAAGDDVVVVDIEGLRFGLSICYDLRFPELYRRLSELGAEVILLPAAFTATTGKAHWHALLRARAVENLCYVLASNQGGVHANQRSTYGHSLIVDPWGNVLAEFDQGAGFRVVDLDSAQQQQIRSRFPALQHRKI
jgi:nitrilase